MLRLDFNNKHWHVIKKVPKQIVDDHSKLKNNYGCDLVIADKTHYWMLNEIIDVDFEEIIDTDSKVVDDPSP